MRRAILGIAIGLPWSGVVGLAQAPLSPPSFRSPQESVRSHGIAPASKPVVLETTVRFDPERVEARRERGQWWLSAGDVWLKDFGSHEREARQAVGYIRALRLTEQVVLGGPVPTFEFYLSNGKPPTGFTGGMQVTPFHPDRLQVRETQGEWRVDQDERPLFFFGRSRDQAERALELIRQHRFNQIGRIGSGRGQLTILLSNDPQMLGTVRPPAGGRQPGRAEIDAGQTLPPLLVERPKPPADPDDSATRLPFDFRQVQLRRADQRWKLLVGTHVLKDFGTHETAARDAYRAVQFYGFTEHCILEEGEHSFEYFLVRGQAPRGRIIGQDAVAFQPESLSIRPVEGGWWIGYGEQRLFRFDSAAKARRALEVIHKHRFNQVCYVGRPRPVMMYLTVTR